MKRLGIFVGLFVFCSGTLLAEDAYDKMAGELVQGVETLSNKKIAIIPFAYVDNPATSKDGSIIAERLTMKLINLQQCEVIERSQLNKVLGELKLQNTGVIDANSTKQLGKILGVEAIITGTLVNTAKGIEVNARLIKTETAQAIKASQVVVEKDWIGGDASPVQQQIGSAYTQTNGTYSKPSQAARGPNEYEFFDVILGVGSKKVDITFENNSYGVYLDQIGFTAVSISNGPYGKVELIDMEGVGAGPVGIRVGGFGKGAMGGDFEFSIHSTIVEPQKGSGLRDGANTTFSLPSSDNYLAMTSIGFSGDLLVRHAGKSVDPYFGIGLGLSLNTVELPFVKGYTESSAYSRPVNDFGVGIMFRIPVGMRIKMDNTQFFGELRYELNSVSFDRDVKNESDNITVDGLRFVMGVGFKF